MRLSTVREIVQNVTLAYQIKLFESDHNDAYKNTIGVK